MTNKPNRIVHSQHREIDSNVVVHKYDTDRHEIHRADQAALLAHEWEFHLYQVLVAVATAIRVLSWIPDKGTRASMPLSYQQYCLSISREQQWAATRRSSRGFISVGLYWELRACRCEGALVAHFSGHITISMATATMWIFTGGVIVLAEISTTLTVSNFALAGCVAARVHLGDLRWFSNHIKLLYRFKRNHGQTYLVAKSVHRGRHQI